MGAVRILPVLVVLVLASGCSEDTDSEPPPTSPQASPSPSRAAAVVGPDLAGLGACRRCGLSLVQGRAH